ncbi:MAG TPA: phosphate ABC transporter permease PstA [Chitinophagales bacterium]|nr:phosphate ABC transporter permease PstA [Chitinophagales bacterium]
MNKRLRWKYFSDDLFKYWGIFCTFFGLLMLGVFLFVIAREGFARLSWQFIVGFPSRVAANAGILPALVGTAWVMVLTALIAIPVGVCAAIYLEEYAKKNRINRILEVNVANLAGVPSIIYGLLGLEIFSRLMGMGGNLLAGSSTLALLVLPIIIVNTREAIKAVPRTLREASFALGATKWQTVRRTVLPAATSSILTGIIISLSRAVGEAAPLIVVGALAYVPFVPTNPTSEFTVLPIQIFNWVSRPQKAFLINASAGIIVLLAITFTLNAIAVYLRIKKRVKY